MDKTKGKKNSLVELLPPLEMMPNSTTVESNKAYFAYLEQQDDLTFFRAGACHIFALELHGLYGYPLYVVENDGDQITHVYCLRRGKPFDVRGDGLNTRYFFETYPGKSRPITKDELLRLFIGDNWNRQHGLWGEPQFMERAITRARHLACKPEYAP